MSVMLCNVFFFIYEFITLDGCLIKKQFVPFFNNGSAELDLDFLGLENA